MIVSLLIVFAGSYSCNYNKTIVSGTYPNYYSQYLSSGQTLCINQVSTPRAVVLFNQLNYAKFFYDYYTSYTSDYTSANYGGYYTGEYSNGVIVVTASISTTISYSTSTFPQECYSTVISNVPNDVFTIGYMSYGSSTPDFSVDNNMHHCYINHNPSSQTVDLIINTEKTYDYVNAKSSSSIYGPYSGNLRKSLYSTSNNPYLFTFVSDKTTLSKFVTIHVLTTSSRTGGRIKLTNTSSRSVIPLVTVPSFLEPPNPTSNVNPTTDYSGAISGLVAACIFYGCLIVVLIFANIVAACIHPNRMYRAGIDCYCCYCCCTDHYYHSHTYYSTHTNYGGGCNCGNCGDCGGGNNDGAAVILLIILLIILICIAFILMYTLYTLCTTDDEERQWESSTFYSNVNSSGVPNVVNNSRIPETKQSIITDGQVYVPAQNPVMPSVIIPNNYDPNTMPTSPYNSQPYNGQNPYPYADPNAQQYNPQMAPPVASPYDDKPPQ